MGVKSCDRADEPVGLKRDGLPDPTRRLSPGVACRAGPVRAPRFSSGSGTSCCSSAQTTRRGPPTLSPSAQAVKCRSDWVGPITIGARQAALSCPVSVTWSQSRYELGVFRVTTQQTLHDRASHNDRVMADPYWGVSLSRRWQLFESGPVRGFVGFGLAGRTKSDELSATRWDFASQLGLRFRLPGNRAIAELTMRHLVKRWRPTTKPRSGLRDPDGPAQFGTVWRR